MRIKRIPIGGLGLFWRPIQVGVQRSVETRRVTDPFQINRRLVIQREFHQSVVVERPAYALAPALWLHVGRGMCRERAIELRLGFGVRPVIQVGEVWTRRILYLRLDLRPMLWRTEAPDRSSAWTGIGWRYAYAWPLHVSWHRGG